MQKIIVLAILFIMSFTLQSFAAYTGADSSLLLAIGFIILAAYTLSEIGSSLKLPRVTGYILAGLLFGPYAFNILTKEVVGEIESINTLAIGLIAVTAGLELHFSSLKKVITSILSTSIFKILTLSLFVVGSFLLIDQFMTDFGFDSHIQLTSLALIFAALCLGTSPAISLAVISETKAKGRLSQLVLGSAIVKDVLVVISMTLAVSFAKSFLETTGNGGGGLSHIFVELGYSLGAGILLGIIFITYIRFIRQEMVLFISVMILATAEVSRVVHLELLLVFIVSGIIVRNFSKAEHILHKTLNKVSLPVFVVFFTNVGAGLDLRTTWQYLPIAGILFTVRALSFFISGYLAGKLHNEKPSIQKGVWLGYLPQAGVTLGLIATASKELPQYAEWINNIGIGLVTLNLLIGPITLRMALRANKETEENSDEIENITADEQTGEVIKPQYKITEEDMEEFTTSISKTITNDKLQVHFESLADHFYKTFKKSQLLPHKNILKSFCSELSELDGATEKDTVQQIDEHFSRMGEKGKDIYYSIPSFQKEIDALQVVTSVPLEKTAIQIQKKDSLKIFILKLLLSPIYWFVKKPERVVPLRKLAKCNLEIFVGKHSLHMINSWYRLLGRHIDTFQKSLESDSLDKEAILHEIEADNERWENSVRTDFFIEFKKVCHQWVEQLNTVDSLYLPDSKIRYSQVEPDIKDLFEQAKKASVDWEEKFIFCRNRLKVVVQTALLSGAVEKLLSDKFFEPLKEASQISHQLVEDVFSHFSFLEQELSTANQGPEFFKKLSEKNNVFTQDHLQANIKSKYIRGSFRLLNRDIALNLRKSLPKEESSFQITSELTPPHKVRAPSEIMVKNINLHELFEQSIFINLLPVIEEKIEGASNYLESLILEMEQAFSILSYTFDSQSSTESELSEDELRESIQATLASEREKINQLYNGLTEYIKESQETAARLKIESQQDVKKGIERFSVVTTAKKQFRQKIQFWGHSLIVKKEQFQKKIQKTYQKAKNFTRSQEERDIDSLVSKKIQSKTLDTTTIRQFIEESYSIQFDLKNLPRVYLRLFSLDAIQDKRFFIAHQSHWRHFENFMSNESSRESQKLLILGDRGMGKSSLLNIAQIDIQSERLIRIDETSYRSPLFGLAQSLGCKNQVRSVLNTLKKQSTTVIIDNIDQWLAKSKLEEFDEFLSLISQSPSQCHWVFSMTKSNFDSFDRAFKIRNVFNKIIDLNETQLETSKEIILSRHRLSGLAINYPKTLLGDLALKVGLSSEDEMFFRVLFERSKGHLRQLIYLWLLSLENSNGKTVDLSLYSGMDRGLPMVAEFTYLQKYVLSEAFCFHRLSMTDLIKDLGVSKAIIDHEVQYLEQAGLIVSKGIDHSQIEIPNHLVYMVGEELKKEGILNEGISKLRN